MPVLKPISGHTSCIPAQRYLEKGGRALARDLLNFDDFTEAQCRSEAGLPVEYVPWAKEMDDLREDHKNDRAWQGRAARTYKHFVLSPSPEDEITLESLRELACAWATESFPEFQAAIVYHDDNEEGILHAHVVVNNTNIITGRRLQTADPLELNRNLQRMAKERGLHAFVDEAPKPETGFQRIAQEHAAVRMRPKTLQDVYRSEAERAIEKDGGKSWVADIRNRVAIAKGLARNEREYRQILGLLDVEVSDNSASARRADWIYSVSGEPSKRVSGERLGAVYGKEALVRGFARVSANRLGNASSRTVLNLAKNAVALENLTELDNLASVLQTCSRWSLKSIDGIDRAILKQQRQLNSSDDARKRARIEENITKLKTARELVVKEQLLPVRDSKARTGADVGSGNWTNDKHDSAKDAQAPQHDRGNRDWRQR